MYMKKILSICSLIAVALATGAGAAEPTKMKAILTVPHEFDMLVKSGHIQGLACSEKGIYLSHQAGLAKIGWDGKLVKHIDAPSHLGGIACANGRIYGAFNIRRRADMKDGMPGLLRVWDEDLNLLSEKALPETGGAVGVLGDTIYYAVGGDKTPHRECRVKRLGLDLSDRGNQAFDFGYDIKYGIQAMATDGKSLVCANYGGVSLANPELTSLKKLKGPSFAEGLALVPKSVAKRDTPVFMAVRALGGNMQGWRKDPVNNPPRLRLEFYEFDGETFKNITEVVSKPGRGTRLACPRSRGTRDPAKCAGGFAIASEENTESGRDGAPPPSASDEDGEIVAADGASPRRTLDFSGCFPSDKIKTIALVMPASVQSKARFDSGKAALEAAGYKVKVMPRLNFEKVALVEDRVADFEQAWMDPEVDLVLCARGGRGSEDLLDKIDWAKLRARPQRVLGSSNITMLLNAMLKEKAGRPFSGPLLSQFLYAKRPAFDWMAKAFAEDVPMPDVKLRALRPGACSGPACGGHIALVLKGVQTGWAADAKGRIVFLETSVCEPSAARGILDELVSSGYFKECAGVVFGDMAAGGPNKTRLSGKAAKAAKAEMARVKKDFAARMSCPVYEGYPYGHVPVSYAIDFLRVKTIGADGVLRQ